MNSVRTIDDLPGPGNYSAGKIPQGTKIPTSTGVSRVISEDAIPLESSPSRALIAFTPPLDAWKRLVTQKNYGCKSFQSTNTANRINSPTRSLMTNPKIDFV